MEGGGGNITNKGVRFKRKTTEGNHVNACRG